MDLHAKATVIRTSKKYTKSCIFQSFEIFPYLLATTVTILRKATYKG